MEPYPRLVALCLAMLAIPAPGLAAAAEIPVEAFSRLPRVTGVQLSPGGNQLAYVLNDLGHSFVVSQPLENVKPTFLVRSDNEELRIRWIRWANDEWLLVSASFATTRHGVPTSETRLFRVRRDSSEPLLLFKPTVSTRHVSQHQDGVVSLLPDDPQQILIALDDQMANFASVYRVNIETGRKKRIREPRPPIRRWMTDQQDRLRLGVGYRDGFVSVQARASQAKKWRELWRYEAVAEAGIEAMGFDADPDTLYVRALHEDRNSVFSVDLTDPTLTRTLLAHDPDYDIDGELIYSPRTRDVVGVYDRGADGSRIYWDDAHGGLQSSVDAALPDTTNLIVAFSRDERRYVVFAWSDVNPGEFYYGDRDAGVLSPFGERYPELADHALSGKQPVAYEARDGLTIEGYLTRPWGERPKPWPTIVLPHGGPTSRNYGEFDYMTEFLASRGYAVFQMNFRGSAGYGWDFRRSGFQDLGGQMQDDVTDGALWLIEQGYSDPARVGIMGGSYGGFAALWGAVKTPDLFRCAVSINGVSDWAAVWAESSNYVNSETVREQLGKRSDLKQVSPLRRAGEIRIPVLIVHGEDDRVVPVSHGRKMARALKKSKKTFRYVELEHGTHTVENERNRTELLGAIDSFLAEHLPRTIPAADAPPRRATDPLPGH